MQESLNGTATEQSKTITLPPSALRKLARLHARYEGAAAVAQAAITAAQSAQAMLQEALTEVCEDEGMAVPQGANAPVDVDWRTGIVKLQQTPQGTVPQPGPVPPPLPVPMLPRDE